RRAQLPLSAERRHTLPAPHLFGNQPAPLRPCISVSFSLRHRATLLCDDHLPQDAVHVTLTKERALTQPLRACGGLRGNSGQTWPRRELRDSRRFGKLYRSSLRFMSDGSFSF